MGWVPFTNSRFQMGVTVMGFAEDSGHCILTLSLRRKQTLFKKKVLLKFIFFHANHYFKQHICPSACQLLAR